MKVIDVNHGPDRSTVATIGAFDGLHLGHRSLIETTKALADQLECASAVITFDRHPSATLRPQSAPKQILDGQQKLELLEAMGIEFVLVLEFDEARAQESANQFIDGIIVGLMRCKAAVVGHDFRFGKSRSGDAATLATAGESLGFTVVQPPIVAVEGDIISSTQIRRLVSEGKVDDAALLLGRPFEVRGPVIDGDKRGRELGFPTANVHVPSRMLLPADGVYAGEYVLPDGSVRRAAISLGTRPMFYENGDVLLEAHLLDFDGDLYGQTAHVRFLSWVRGQEKFDSLDSLISRIESDIREVRLRS